jgi:hypothetical protein
VQRAWLPDRYSVRRKKILALQPGPTSALEPHGNRCERPDIQVNRGMKTNVLFRRDHPDVLRAVVGPDAVAMVNEVTAVQRPSKKFGCDHPVLWHFHAATGF